MYYSSSAIIHRRSIMMTPRFAFFTAALALPALAAATATCLAQEAAAAVTDQPPNIVIIFCDDLGYADIGPFGATAYKTPRLDRMAAEGRTFTDFHSATAVCSASRVALMTGCYPERVSILGALNPHTQHGINAEELTLAELCRGRGYATAIYGKWHLGHHQPFLPLQHGFDEYFGLPYSNDMWPNHPDLAKLPPAAAERKRRFPPLPLFENNDIIDAEVDGNDQTQLTRKYTEHAVDFIDRNKSRPFFLYVPHTMVHVPLYVSEAFQGKSGAGLFGDVMAEIDWSVGQILDAICRNDLDEKTLVVFTSDNGPWLSYGKHGGSAGPLRDGKGTMFEGGYRVPCVMRWPGRIPAGTRCDELAITFDLFPTIAHLIGAPLPQNRVIDGKDIWPLMSGEPEAESPHDAFYCYYGRELRAVRDRRWKLHFPHRSNTLAGKPGGRDGNPAPYQQIDVGNWLFDLKHDIGETTDVAADHPDIVARLQRHAERARAALGDALTGRQGNEVRPAGELAGVAQTAPGP
jgi:arylsulfatase A-like enzyme